MESPNTSVIPTELVSHRSVFGKVFAVGAGKYRAFQGSVQMHHMNEITHEWEEVDARFLPSKEDKSISENDAEKQTFISQGALLTTVCGNAGREPFIRISDKDGNRISWGMEDAQAVAPEAFEYEPDKEEKEDSALSVFRQAQRRAEGNVAYRDIFPGVTMICHSGSSFKEEVVFSSQESARKIIYNIYAEKLILQKKQDDQIDLVNEKGEHIFTITRPFMYDSAEREGKVHVLLERIEDNYRLIYSPDTEFMSNATYPVMLDPVIRSSQESSSMVDTYVCAGSTADYSASNRLNVTDNTASGLQYSLLKVNQLPTLGANHFITEGKLRVHSMLKPSGNTGIYCREVQGDWNPTTVTFATLPSYNSAHIQDYILLPSGNTYQDWYAFDITALVKKWYHGDNHGLILMPPETAYRTAAFSSIDASADSRPYVEICYSTLAGLEDYLTYDGVSAGRAGSGKISLVNGNMVFLHNDTMMNGARMPVSVTHVYNSCDANTDPFGCGYGWRTNYHQTLHKEYLDETVYYVYTDGDGTEHWFKPTSSAANKYKDESGLSMELTPGDPTEIRDKGDNVMRFPQITDVPTASYPTTDKVLIASITDACGNTVTITGTGMKITQITDGAGRVTVFSYSGDRLSAIRTPWQNSENCVRFSYTGGVLDRITYEDDRYSAYTYHTDAVLGYHLLETASSPEGITVSFTYTNTNVSSGLMHVVTETQVVGGALAAGHTSYSYAVQMCLATDLLTGNSLRYHFNENGNCISVDDGLGYAVFAEYDQSGANADAPVNHPTSSSRIQRVVNNLLADGLQCKTSGSAWTKYGTGTIAQSYNGSGFGRYEKKFTVSNGNILYLRQTVNVTAGKTYTLSGYTQSLGAKAYLRVTTGNHVFQSIPVELHGTETETELERTQITFTVPNDITSISCDMMAEGTARGTVAWWDSAQLEEGETANHVNLLENSQMKRTASSGLPDCWIADTNCASYLSWQARADCSVAMPENLPGDALHVAGRYDRSTRVFQNINAKGKAGDKLTVGGWGSSYAKKTNISDSILCRIQVFFCSSNAADWDNWGYGGSVEFNHEEGNWQFACANITAPRDFNWIRIAIQYNRQMNYADFSNLFVYKEQFGAEYVYDAKGNRKSRTSPAGNTGKSTYDDYNNVLTSASPGRTVTTSYAWGDTEAEKRKHLLRQSVSPLGTVNAFQYDAYGNTIETQKKESGASTAKFIKTTAAYTAAGTYAVSQTDARGKTATTVTDPDRGTVTQSTDPLGQEANSQYDALRRLIKTSTLLNNQEVKTEHTYDSQTGYLTGTSHNTDGDPTHSVVYHFGYDSLGRQTSVSVGSNVLSTTYFLHIFTRT